MSKLLQQSQDGQISASKSKERSGLVPEFRARMGREGNGDAAQLAAGPGLPEYQSCITARAEGKAAWKLVFCSDTCTVVLKPCARLREQMEKYFMSQVK